MDDKKFKEIYDSIDKRIWDLDINSTREELNQIMNEIKELNNFIRGRRNRQNDTIRLLMNLNGVVQKLKEDKDKLYRQSPDYKSKVKEIRWIGFSIIAISLISGIIFKSIVLSFILISIGIFIYNFKIYRLTK